MHVPANVAQPETGIAALPGKLPICEIPPSVNLSEVARELLTKLPVIPDDFFTEDCLWRDILSMTQTLRTIFGGERARATWLHLNATRKPTNFQLVEDCASVSEVGRGNRFAFAAFTFETTGAGFAASHLGFLNFVPDPSGTDHWRVWSMQTMLEGFIGHEMINLRKAFPDPKRDIEPASDVGLSTNRMYRDYVQQHKGARNASEGQLHPRYLTKRDHRTAPGGERKVDVIVIGAGQAGLCSAGYCKALDLEAVVIEQNEEIGDNWTKRYPELYLHTPHRFNDLAFGPTFNESEYSEWLTSAELKRGYQYFVKRFEIETWLSTKVSSCNFDRSKMQWTVKSVQRGEEKTLYADHIILAIGSGGNRPLMPHYPGESNYLGKVLHSVQYKGAEEFQNKKAIVVGTANTGHDMADSLQAGGAAEITMIQRATTYVIPRDFMSGFLNFMWPPHSVRSQDMSDRLFWSTPTAAMRAMCFNIFDPQFDAAPELFDGLEAAGFRCDRRGDFIDHLLVRFGGHYMNHGTSEKIVEGKIKVKGNATIAAYTEDGLEFTDGTKIQADVIIFATGFEKDMTLAAGTFLPQEVTKSLEEFWGVDEEGEHRGAFVPSGFPNIWMTGGGCAHARFFTRLIALQIQSAQLGKPMEPFKETKLKVH